MGSRAANAAAAEAIPGAIEVDGSRAFIQASATKLHELQERDLSGEDVVAPCWTARRSPRRRWSSRWASR